MASAYQPFWKFKKKEKSFKWLYQRYKQLLKNLSGYGKVYKTDPKIVKHIKIILLLISILKWNTKSFTEKKQNVLWVKFFA